MNHPFYPLFQKGRQAHPDPWRRSPLSGVEGSTAASDGGSLLPSMAFSLLFSAVFTAIALAAVWSWNPVDFFHSATGVVWSEILVLGGILFGLVFLVSLPLVMLLRWHRGFPGEPTGFPTSEA